MGYLDNPNLIARQRVFNKLLACKLDIFNSDILDAFVYYQPIKQETKMAYNEQLNMFINTGKEMSEKLQHAYKMGVEAGKREAQKQKEEEKKKPKWIPALVRYQEVPDWWRMKEQKSQLMGEVILVKEVSEEETSRFENEYGQSKANFWSKRNDVGGKWYWNKKDLILYPDSVEVEMYASAKFAHNKGKKKKA